jgi:hypothetical protein
VAAQAECKFRQFATVKEAFGKGVADSVNFDKITNVVTSGGTLTETATMPTTYFTITKSTLTVYEYGNSVPYTGKLEVLSQEGIRNLVVKALKNDQVKVLDAAVEAQMDACKYRYVSSTASTGNFTTNGTATLTATFNLNAYHWKVMVDQLMTLNAPPADGENYMAILSISAARGIHDDLEDVWKYTKYPTNGEIGSYYKCRAVRDNYAMDNTIGASNVTGEAYFFGDDAIMEAVALPEEIRYEEEDFARSKKLAWYAILGFKIIWESDPDDRIIKWTSA